MEVKWKTKNCKICSYKWLHLTLTVWILGRRGPVASHTAFLKNQKEQKLRSAWTFLDGCILQCCTPPKVNFQDKPLITSNIVPENLQNLWFHLPKQFHCCMPLGKLHLSQIELFPCNRSGVICLCFSAAEEKWTPLRKVSWDSLAFYQKKNCLIFLIWDH